MPTNCDSKKQTKVFHQRSQVIRGKILDLVSARASEDS